MPSEEALARMTAALEANTEALRDLRAALLESDEGGGGGADPDAEPAFYLDGTPRGD